MTHMPHAIQYFCLSLILVLPVLAQTATPSSQPATVLNPQRTRQAFDLVQQWLNNGQIAVAEDPWPDCPATGVLVSLRYQGVIMGRAEAWIEHPLQTDPAKDKPLIKLLQIATGKALLKAKARFDAPHMRPSTQPSAKETQDRARAFAELCKKMTIDLEIAGPLSPVRLDNWRQLPNRLQLGTHGVALTHNKQWAILFPAQMLQANLNHDTALIRLINQLDMPLSTRTLLGRGRGPAIYRFRAIEMVNLRPGGFPIQLIRGSMEKQIQPLNNAQLQTMADRLARRLISWQRSDGSFIGVYAPSANQATVKIAKPADTGMICMALTHYARTPATDPQMAEAAMTTVKRALGHLIQQARLSTGIGHQSPDPKTITMADTALLLINLIDVPNLPNAQAHRRALADRLAMMQHSDGWFRAGMLAGSRKATHTAQALGAYALVRQYDLTRDPNDRKRAEKALDGLWQQIDDARFASTLPWLPMAEYRMQTLTDRNQTLPAIRRQFLLLWKLQLTEALARQTGLPADTIGGMLVGTGPTGEPNWHSARILISFAQAARHEQLVETSLLGSWLTNCRYLAGFIERLGIDPITAHYMYAPQLALYGTRLSFYDNQQPAQTSAMALMGTVELIRSIADTQPRIDQLQAQQSDTDKKQQ